MARSTTLRLRAAWFQVHKWIGILLAILIIPLSLSGSALVWHDGLDALINPGRYAVGAGVPLRPVGDYAAATTAALGPGERIASIRLPEGGQGPVIVSAARAPDAGAAANRRPVRVSYWLDPADGRILDHARSDRGAVRVLHMLHGTLLVPGVGRQIVGWIGVAMLLSALSGLWLWWPLRGRWTRGLRWRRQTTVNANLHHQAGFWIAIPLAMLSLTGAWISFPAFFGMLSGAPQQRGPGGSPGAGARPIAAPALSVAQAAAAARPHATGPLVLVNWPTDKAPTWKLSFQRGAGLAEVEVDDASGRAAPPKPPRAEPIARLMRRLHDGTGMGRIWQVAIFAGGLLPALLAVTGIIMWLRTRGWRADIVRRRRHRALAPAE